MLPCILSTSSARTGREAGGEAVPSPASWCREPCSQASHPENGFLPAPHHLPAGAHLRAVLPLPFPRAGSGSGCAHPRCEDPLASGEGGKEERSCDQQLLRFAGVNSEACKKWSRNRGDLSREPMRQQHLKQSSQSKCPGRGNREGRRGEGGKPAAFPASLCSCGCSLRHFQVPHPP